MLFFAEQALGPLRGSACTGLQRTGEELQWPCSFGFLKGCFLGYPYGELESRVSVGNGRSLDHGPKCNPAYAQSWAQFCQTADGLGQWSTFAPPQRKGCLAWTSFAISEMPNGHGGKATESPGSRGAGVWKSSIFVWSGGRILKRSLWGHPFGARLLTSLALTFLDSGDPSSQTGKKARRLVERNDA